MNKLDDKVAINRILLFTKVILTMLAISLLVFMNFLDLQSTRRNQQYLNFLFNFYKSYADGLEFEKFEIQRMRYLQNNQGPIARLHLESRDSLINILRRVNMPITLETKGENKQKNRFVLMTSVNGSAIHKPVTNSLPLKLSERATVDSVLKCYISQKPGDTALLLTGFNHAELLYKLIEVRRRDSIGLLNFISYERKKDSVLRVNVKQPIEVSIPSNVSAMNSFGSVSHPTDTVLERPTVLQTEYKKLVEDKSFRLAAKIPRASGAGPWPFTERLNHMHRFNELQLSEDKLTIFLSPKFNDDSPASGEGGQGGSDQSNPSNVLFYQDSVTVTAQTKTLTFPSTLEFAGLDSVMVRELVNQKNAQEEIHNFYGYYSIYDVGKLSSDEFERNSRAVSILGFDISRKWFPFAMYLVLAVVYFFLFQTTSIATLGGKVLSSMQTDDILSFLIINKTARFCLWVVSPVIIIVIVNYSRIHYYDFIMQTLMIFLGIACIVLGCLSCLKSGHWK